MTEGEIRLFFKSGDREGESLDVTGDRFTIGRAEGADLTLDDDEVSREHAEIRRAESGYEIADLGSRNGVFVNDRKITEPTALRSGDEIRVGDSALLVRGSGAETRFAGGETALGGAGQGGGETKMASTPLTLAGRSGPAKGQTITVTDTVVIGRDETADVVLDDEEVSRRHAELRATEPGQAEIRDLGSRNGTWVNGQRIAAPTPLRGGESVRIGQSELAAEGAGATAAAAPTPPTAKVPPSDRAVAAAGATPSVIQRVKTDKNARRASILAGAALLIAAIAVILAVTGVFSSDEEGIPSGREVVADVTPSTVLVNAYDGEQRTGNGSGWVYDADQGLAVTNAHVIAGGSRFELGVGEELRRANVVGVAVCEDLALLRTNRHAGLETLALGDQDEIQLGDRAFVIGYPGNASIDDELQVTEGTVSLVETRPDISGVTDPDAGSYSNVVQLDATINSGNSGGPAVNDDRELIGVNTFTAGIEDQNFAIGVDRVKEVVPQLAEGDSLGYAGFDFEALSPKDLEKVAIEEEAPGALAVARQLGGALLINSVLPNSTGDQVGLTPGILIVSVGGTRTETRQDYCNAVQDVESGETVPVEVVDPISGDSGTIRIPFE